MKWHDAPRSIDRNLKDAQTQVLYFGNDGRFAVIHCTIYRRNDNWTVSGGDPQGVYVGRWKRVGADVAVTYRLAWRTIEIAGPHSQEPEHDATLKFAPDGSLVFLGKVFRRATHRQRGRGPGTIGRRKP